jgi:hypothetical protein
LSRRVAGVRQIVALASACAAGAAARAGAQQARQAPSAEIVAGPSIGISSGWGGVMGAAVRLPRPSNRFAFGITGSHSPGRKGSSPAQFPSGTQPDPGTPSVTAVELAGEFAVAPICRGSLATCAPNLSLALGVGLTSFDGPVAQQRVAEAYAALCVSDECFFEGPVPPVSYQGTWLSWVWGASLEIPVTSGLTLRSGVRWDVPFSERLAFPLLNVAQTMTRVDLALQWRR